MIVLSVKFEACEKVCFDYHLIVFVLNLIQIKVNMIVLSIKFEICEKALF